MQLTGQVLVLDAADLAAESAFWAALLGGTVAAREDWHSVIVDGAVAVGVQLAPEHQAPAWPNGAQQVHLDLYVEDITVAHVHATDAGAKLLQVSEGSEAQGGFHVYADPAGHPFCLCWGPPPLGQAAATHLGRPAPEQEAPSEPVRLAVVDPGEDRAQAVVRAAMADIASRYYQRPATPGEVDAALADDPADDLALPRGLLVVATTPAGAASGCAGLRLLPGATGEIKKVYVAPTARGLGLGRRLVEEIEHLAALHGCTTVRLDTRSDLVEARRLYARLGYAEVAPFNAGPYAEHWFAKDLPPPARGSSRMGG